MNALKKLFLSACVIMCLALPGCRSAAGASAVPAPVTLAVSEDPKFGGAWLMETAAEFNARGFRCGDSLDVEFSDGKSFRDIPYYNGYYCRYGKPLVVAYPGYRYVCLALSGSRIWESLGLSDGATAKVSLRERGKYLAIQNAFGLTYSDNRDDYASDEAFANFRSLSGGKLKRNLIYRSASPCDDSHGRARFADALAKAADVRRVIDMSDSEEEISALAADGRLAGTHFSELHETGSVLALDVGADYEGADFGLKLARGLDEISGDDGPFLIHCVEGKDRTGFAATLLEFLAGASRDEAERDYMLSYVNYYGIADDPTDARYRAIADVKFADMADFLLSLSDDGTYSSGAANYLLRSGMSPGEVDALVAVMTGS